MKKGRLFRVLALLLTAVLLCPAAMGCGSHEQLCQSVYELAVSFDYTGSEEEFFTALAQETIGQGSAYEAAVDKGYTGTVSQWLTPLVGETVEAVPEGVTAFDLVVANGYTGTSEEWLNSLAGENSNLRISLSKLRPSFAWIDDDGKKYVYSDLYPWALENNVPFTTAVITGMFSGYITQEQITEMYDSGMVTVASHTQNHKRLSTLSDEQLVTEITDSKRTIEGWGIPCDIMVYPYGDVDQRGIDLVRKDYTYGLIAGGPTNSAGVHTGNRVNYPPVNTYRIQRVAVSGGMSTYEQSLIRAQIDEACANNGMIVFMSHIGINSSVPPEQDLALYTQIVNYIRSKGYDIEPVEQVLDRFSNLVEVGDWSANSPDDYFVIGADGSVHVDEMNGQVVAADNAYTNASTPSQYPQNQITTCYITGGSAGTGLPGAPRGILTAYLVGKTGYRMYMPATSTDLYVQIRSSTKDAWNSWVKVNDNIASMLSNNKVLPATLPSALPSGVSYCIVTNAAALDALPGDGTMGYLTNYKVSSNSANVRQEWQPFDSVTTYIRLADTSSKWGPWYELEPTLVD